MEPSWFFHYVMRRRARRAVQPPPYTARMHTTTAPACPVCGLENTYPDGTNWICPDCTHEWPMAADADTEAEADTVVRDSNGTPLATGDAVILIKDLKVKGSSTVLKKGTKIKSIRLPEGAGDHEVDCKTDQGAFMLKAEFLKKA
jgi:protein PhnA